MFAATLIYIDASMLVTTVFGERLKQLRDVRRLTQDGLASQVGVSRQTISNWETGTSAPNSVDLPLLAQALGVTVAALYGDEQFIRPTGISSEERTGRGGVRSVDELRYVRPADEGRDPDIKPLPIYRWGSLGDPRDRNSAPSPDREEYPPLGRERLIGPRGFAVEVRGESMVGRDLRDGDVVWVNPDRPYRVGGLVLALVDNGEGDSGMVVKTYAQNEIGDCLVSETEAGKSTVVCKEFKIIGPVVWIQRGWPPR